MAQTNGYLIGDGDESLLVDAPEGVCGWLEELGVRPQALLLTHQHYDHVWDAAQLGDWGAKLYAFSQYDEELTLAPLLKNFGMDVAVAPYKIDEVLEGQDEITVSGLHFQLKHVPGHSMDSVAFIAENLANGCVFAGDTLMAGSCGRTDLPGGNMQLLINSITNAFEGLPDGIGIFSGHGPTTTLGAEKASNMIYRAAASG